MSYKLIIANMKAMTGFFPFLSALAFIQKCDCADWYVYFSLRSVLVITQYRSIKGIVSFKTKLRTTRESKERTHINNFVVVNILKAYLLPLCYLIYFKRTFNFFKKTNNLICLI
jgi:hypothetical protein